MKKSCRRCDFLIPRQRNRRARTQGSQSRSDFSERSEESPTAPAIFYFTTLQTYAILLTVCYQTIFYWKERKSWLISQKSKPKIQPPPSQKSQKLKRAKAPLKNPKNPRKNLSCFFGRSLLSELIFATLGVSFDRFAGQTEKRPGN